MNNLFTTALCATVLLISATGSAQPGVPNKPVTQAAAPAVEVGQMITIRELQYKVSAKKVLAPGVEYYTAKATAPKSVAKSFLKTNGEYNPTVFSQSEFESFIRTGKLSSFGALSTYADSGATLTYVTKGTTQAAFGIRQGELAILEMPGDVVDVIARQQQQNSNGKKPSPARLSCYNLCKVDDVQCQKELGEGAHECFDDWYYCTAICNYKYPREGKPSLHIIRPATVITKL